MTSLIHLESRDLGFKSSSADDMLCVPGQISLKGLTVVSTSLKGKINENTSAEFFARLH